jgi:hypothetical protein
MTEITSIIPYQKQLDAFFDTPGKTTRNARTRRYVVVMSTSLTDLDHRVSVLENLFQQEIRAKATREEVRAWNSSTHTDIKAFQDDVDRRFRESDAGINARFDAVDGAFGLIDGQFEKVDLQFKEFRKEVRDQFKEVRDQFKEVGDQFKSVNTRLDEVLAAVRSGRVSK